MHGKYIDVEENPYLWGNAARYTSIVITRLNFPKLNKPYKYTGFIDGKKLRSETRKYHFQVVVYFTFLVSYIDLFHLIH